jgi:hypothetical protein
VVDGKANSLTLKLVYKNLDASFFWKKLWREATDIFCFQYTNEVKNLKCEIVFPDKLPDNFRTTEIGATLIPENWGTITRGKTGQRQKLTLEAPSLRPNEKYKIKIDMSKG